MNDLKPGDILSKRNEYFIVLKVSVIGDETGIEMLDCYTVTHLNNYGNIQKLVINLRDLRYDYHVL